MRIVFLCTPAYVTSKSTDSLTFQTTRGGAETTIAMKGLLSCCADPSEVRLDDYNKTGCLSYLVPAQEPHYTDTGALYLVEPVWPGFPPGEMLPGPPHDYELSAVYYPPNKDLPAYGGRRYHGFHAEVVAREGTLALCKVWPAGYSQEADVSPVQVWVDLALAEHCDAALGPVDPSKPTDLEKQRIDLKTDSGTGALYLETEWAASLGLAVPKVPMSAGGVLITGGTSVSEAQQLAAAMPDRLNVATRRPTGGLTEILAKIDPKTMLRVDDLDELVDALRTWAAQPGVRGQARRRLDLIGHTVGADHLLALGSTTISWLNADVSKHFPELARLLELLNVDHLGLVGCQSAQSKLAQETITVLANQLWVKVDGYCQLLTVDDFDTQGVEERVRTRNLNFACPAFSLHPAPAVPLFEHSLSLDRPRIGAEGRQIGEHSVAQIAGCLGQVFEAGASMNVPDMHVVVAERRGGRTASFDVIEDFSLVQVFPAVHQGRPLRSLVYEVKDRSALRALLDASARIDVFSGAQAPRNALIVRGRPVGT